MRLSVRATTEWALLDLNQGPSDYESGALTTELRARAGKIRLPAPGGDNPLTTRHLRPIFRVSLNYFVI